MKPAKKTCIVVGTEFAKSKFWHLMRGLDDVSVFKVGECLGGLRFDEVLVIGGYNIAKLLKESSAARE